MSEYIVLEATESIQSLFLDENGATVTGASPVITIRRLSDDYFFDFNDSTFKASGWTTREGTMIEVDATNDAGVYSYDFNTAGLSADKYYIRTHLSTAANSPQTNELVVGSFYDDVADVVWDEVIDASNHNGAKSAGKRLRQAGVLIATDGEVIGTPTTTVIQTNITEATDDHYKSQTFVFTSGVLEGQARIVQAYDGTTKTFTFDEAFTDTPSATDEFEVRANHIHDITEYQTALSEYEVMLNPAYNEDADEITYNVWFEVNGASKTAVTNCTINVYAEDGTLQHTLSDATPDAQGVFKMTQSVPGFSDGKSYYAVCQLEYNSTTYQTLKGLVTTN